MAETIDLKEARAKVKADDVCPRCNNFLGNEFVPNEEPFGPRVFDGVICDDGKAYHHGCEPC